MVEARRSGTASPRPVLVAFPTTMTIRRRPRSESLEMGARALRNTVATTRATPTGLGFGSPSPGCFRRTGWMWLRESVPYGTLWWGCGVISMAWLCDHGLWCGYVAVEAPNPEGAVLCADGDQVCWGDHDPLPIGGGAWVEGGGIDAMVVA
jgi:hypothetical protein